MSIPLCITSFVTMVPVSILNGWMLSLLWRWFVVPVFQLPSLSIAEAIGFALVARHIAGRVHPSKETLINGWIDLVLAMLNYMIYAGTILITGWIVQGFI